MSNLVTQGDIGVVKFNTDDLLSALDAHANADLSTAHGIQVVTGVAPNDVYSDSNQDTVGEYQLVFVLNDGQDRYVCPARLTTKEGQPQTSLSLVEPSSASSASSWITEYASSTGNAVQLARSNYLLPHTRLSYTDAHSSVQFVAGAMFTPQQVTKALQGVQIGTGKLRILVDGVYYYIPCTTRLGGVQAAPSISSACERSFNGNVPIANDTSKCVAAYASTGNGHPPGGLGKFMVNGGSAPFTFNWEWCKVRRTVGKVVTYSDNASDWHPFYSGVISGYATRPNPFLTVMTATTNPYVDAYTVDGTTAFSTAYVGTTIDSGQIYPKYNSYGTGTIVPGVDATFRNNYLSSPAHPTTVTVAFYPYCSGWVSGIVWTRLRLSNASGTKFYAQPIKHTIVCSDNYLCTAAFGMGLISEANYQLSAQRLERCNITALLGYRTWGEPLSRAVRVSPKLARVVMPLVLHWTRWLNTQKAGTGAVLHYGIGALSWVVGLFSRSKAQSQKT